MRLFLTLRKKIHTRDHLVQAQAIDAIEYSYYPVSLFINRCIASSLILMQIVHFTNCQPWINSNLLGRIYSFICTNIRTVVFPRHTIVDKYVHSKEYDKDICLITILREQDMEPPQSLGQILDGDYSLSTIVIMTSIIIINIDYVLYGRYWTELSIYLTLAKAL